MSEDTNTHELQQDELQTLKDRADRLGVKYHPSIKLETLREKLAAAMAGEPAAEKPAVEQEAPVETEGQMRKRLQLQASRLVRIRLTCMNPAKREWDGEIITVGNSVVGTFRKFVPFNADEGWHVPEIMLRMLEARECQVFTTVKTAHGVSVRRGKLIKEFAIEILPPLNQEELDELARRQALAGSID